MDGAGRSLYDVRPLVTALQKIADAGRARKAAGTDDEAVEYARLAHTALEYFMADGNGEVDKCIRLLDRIQKTKL